MPLNNFVCIKIEHKIDINSLIITGVHLLFLQYIRYIRQIYTKLDNVKYFLRSLCPASILYKKILAKVGINTTNVSAYFRQTYTFKKYYMTQFILQIRKYDILLLEIYNLTNSS